MLDGRVLEVGVGVAIPVADDRAGDLKICAGADLCKKDVPKAADGVFCICSVGPNPIYLPIPHFARCRLDSFSFSSRVARAGKLLNSLGNPGLRAFGGLLMSLAWKIADSGLTTGRVACCHMAVAFSNEAARC